MPNMVSVIQKHKTSLLKNPTPTDIKECSCHQKTECPLNKKCLSGYQVYNTLVDWLDTKKTKHYCGTFEKNFKSVITITQHLLEIKIKEKALNSESTSWS